MDTYKAYAICCYRAFVFRSQPYRTKSPHNYSQRLFTELKCNIGQLIMVIVAFKLIDCAKVCVKSMKSMHFTILLLSGVRSCASQTDRPTHAHC